MSLDDKDYISLTDMLKAKDGDFFISDWLRNRNTVEFLGIWEQIHNPNFNYGEFAIIRSNAGLNSYKISVKEWTEKTNAIGIFAKAGRYGGTYAYKDIAFEFGMTAKQWRENNMNSKGNIRDYASINELICLSNMENINAVLIADGVPQKERLIKLNKIAIHQMMLLEDQKGHEILAKALLRILFNEGYISNATYQACIEELEGKQNKKY